MADQHRDEWERPMPAHVTTPLLTRIIEQSMDEDYEQVARRRAGEGTPTPPGPPRLVASVVVVVFGILVTTAAVQTSRNADVNSESREVLISKVKAEREAVEAQQDEIARLQALNIALEDRLENATQDEEEEAARARRLATTSGFAPVTGPGVRVSLDDPPDADPSELVRDEDLAKLVDVLWSVGAEAISINGQRLTVLTSIRNRGPAVRVNSQPVNPPYTIQAIGDVSRMQSLFFDHPRGQAFADLANDLGFAFDMQNVDSLSIPAAPEPRLRHARPGTSDAPNKNQEAPS
jgi:uncharacterized protein YlxW (UPF0749 family)